MVCQTLPVVSSTPSGRRQQCIHSTASQTIHAYRRFLRCRSGTSTPRVGRTAQLLCRAEQTATEKTRPLVAAAPAQSDGGTWVPVIAPEDLPKGVRKEVAVSGVSILLFWYRNEIYAIEARSPAEGAYSEGFISSKFTQDFCIECPATSSLFSLKTGEIVSWYPNNPVLRLLTPKDTCRNLQIYPVRLTQDAIEVDVTGSAAQQVTLGGSDSSLEKNNVYGIEPKVYTESAASESSGPDVAAVATGTISVLGCMGVAAAGTATAKYIDTEIGLYIFWAIYVVVIGAYAASKLGGSKS